MRKLIVVLVLSGVVSCAFAEAAAIDQKVAFSPYGFVKGDMYYVQGGDVQSWGKPSLTCASKAVKTGTGGRGISFSAQHTRLGFKGNGQLGTITMGGLIEMDFFVIASNANAKPRMRLAYAWCQPVKGLDIRAGQQWDLFSPLNPSTNNTNANLWFNGNFGFRRPQLYLGYTLDLGKVLPGIQVSAGETTKEDELAATPTFLGEDNKSGVPMIQYRGFVNLFSKAILGLAGVYSTYGEDKDFNTTGFSADLDLPIHKFFSLKGEFAMGTNLNNANLFTIAGDGNAAVDVKTMGFWVNATTKPVDFFNLVLGVAQEMNTTEDLLAGAPESNFTFYSDFIFPIGKYFSLSAEYQLLKTTLKGTDSYKANVIDIAGVVNF